MILLQCRSFWTFLEKRVRDKNGQKLLNYVGSYRLGSAKSNPNDSYFFQGLSFL